MSNSLASSMLRDRVLVWLADHVSPHRIRHILGVEQIAGELAMCHNVNVAKAQMAGLMHDLAKFFKPQILLEMARAEGLKLDSVLETVPHLLHADVSAVVARNEFGVQDEDILQAIANHTLGQPGMDQLSCIVFIADAIEPSRGNGPELEEMRSLSQKNLHAAVWRTCDYSFKHLLETHCLIHPRTILTRNWALTVDS